MPNPSSPPSDAELSEMTKTVFPEGPTHYIGFDLETSGLKAGDRATADCILEVGFVVVDAKTLETVDEGWTCVVPPYVETAEEFERWREKLAVNNPFVSEMHTKNGLLDFISVHVKASEKYSGVLCTCSKIEQELIERFSKFLPFGARVEDVNEGNSPLVLAGNSMANLDIPMLRLWMPALHEMFSYRIMDVSVLRMFYNDIAGIKLPDGLNEYISSGGGDESVHRAFDDARHAMHALRRLVGYARNVEKEAQGRE